MLPVTTIGVVLAILGTFMIIPAAIGIAEYDNADSDTKKKEKVQIGLQCLILIGSIVIMIAGYSIMYQSHTLNSIVRFGYNGHTNLAQEINTHLRGENATDPQALVDKIQALHPNGAQHAMNYAAKLINRASNNVGNRGALVGALTDAARGFAGKARGQGLNRQNGRGR